MYTIFDFFSYEPTYAGESYDSSTLVLFLLRKLHTDFIFDGLSTLSQSESFYPICSTPLPGHVIILIVFILTKKERSSGVSLGSRSLLPSNVEQCLVNVTCGNS